MLQDLKLDPAYEGFLYLAESTRNPPSLKSHRHVELEINFVARGRITYVVGRRRFTFGPRTLLWMFPSREHQLVDRTSDAQYYVAVFKPGLIERSCHQTDDQELKAGKSGLGLVPHTVLDSDTCGFIRQMMDRIMEGSIDPDTLNRQAGFGVDPDFRYSHSDPDGLNAGLHHLLLLCWRLQQAGASGQESVSLHPAVSKALRILANDVWSGTLGQLACECGLSQNHFCRLFAQQVGVPFHRYRNTLRLARFEQLWRSPVKQTIMEVVYAAGFGSYAQFYKVFAEAYGRGPRQGLKNR